MINIINRNLLNGDVGRHINREYKGGKQVQGEKGGGEMGGN